MCATLTNTGALLRRYTPCHPTTACSLELSVVPPGSRKAAPILIIDPIPIVLPSLGGGSVDHEPATPPARGLGGDEPKTTVCRICFWRVGQKGGTTFTFHQLATFPGLHWRRPLERSLSRDTAQFERAPLTFAACWASHCRHPGRHQLVPSLSASTSAPPAPTTSRTAR
jgi:hypothetical protein